MRLSFTKPDVFLLDTRTPVRIADLADKMIALTE